MSQNYIEWNPLAYLPENFSLLKSTFSIEPFHSVIEAVVVLGIYAVAACVLPWIMNLILAPFGFALMLLGAIGVGIGIYQYLTQDGNAVDMLNNRTNTGMFLFTLGALLSFASVLAPFMIAALAGYRIITALPAEYLEPINSTASQLKD